ncbi:MAG TPA: SH3 domain-containing protein, partial [Deltaproteobacteria bacterium]|nr:SH3 domain-containing protein [Deltaproteobacteria bacterium]
LYSDMKRIDIDRLQNSALDIGTPVAILHATRDGSWIYVVAPLCEGWIKAEDVGLCSREEMASYVSAEPFVVTTGTKVDLFLDDDLRDHHAYVRMGCRFPTKDAGSEDISEIVLPFRGSDGRCTFEEAYVAGSDVSFGYLPYTPRTIILQAFKLLNFPYGWGDMHGEQDCSRFIQEIFSTVGIELPRNSSQQARVGRLIARFKGDSSEENRLDALSDNSIGGISILQMNGHIMLFLGNVDRDPYAIHDMRGYSESGPDGERLMVVNRVVVSNLRIGEGTRSGPFLKRLVTVRAFEIGPT